MGKYRKKPVVVEAFHFTDETKNMVFNDLGAGPIADVEDCKPIMRVITIHGEEAIVRLGDWVIKEAVPGKFYPCKPEIFAKTYEPVEEDAG